MPSPVHNSLGADLVWWRTAGGMRTVACLYWGGDHGFNQPVHLVACLHGKDGAELARWRVPLPQDAPLFFDSAAQGAWSAFAGADGILALHLCTDETPGPEALRHERLYPTIDWHSSDGHLATLHSDQIVSRHVTTPQDFTEIVVIETETELNALVILNGVHAQAPAALSLTVANHRGETRTASFGSPMPPWTAVTVPLAAMFPGLAAFGGGSPLLVEGRFDSKGLFTRPYVLTTGSRRGAYHGGDLYQWTAVHPARHAMIQGEVNPMAVVLDEQTRTWINLLHSHGGHEDDVPVDVRLFDDEGRCVLDQREAFVAGRRRLTRVDLATLLPPGTQRFSGHVSLSYSVRNDLPVPTHVQALLEYQRGDSVAHVMGWSDEWNSRPVLARRKRGMPHVNRSYYRVWRGGELETEVLVTNAGHRDYSETAKATLTLQSGDGAAESIEVEIAPYATLRGTVAGLFGALPGAIGGGELAVLRIDSTSDLAAMSITRNRQGNALAMEHFMSLFTLTPDGLRMPAGS